MPRTASPPRSKQVHRSTPRSDRTSEAYRRLRELIIEARLAPGTTLNETELSVRLGVSRTPIREALVRLQQEGLIATAGIGQRLMVSALTAEDMREVFMIVGALEGLAVRLAASLGPNERLPIAREMRRLNEALRTATSATPPDIAAAKELHVRLHRCAVDAAAGPRLQSELDALHSQWERYERAYTSVVAFEFKNSLGEHDAVINAIEAGDPDTAERSAIRNYRNGADRCQRVVAMIGERGTW
jgi:DNA-binding GntR family transcriptional regulator